MNNKPKNPIDAEADMIRRSIRAAIDSLTPKEKDAFYQAMADALQEAFGTGKIIPELPRSAKPEHRAGRMKSVGSRRPRNM